MKLRQLVDCRKILDQVENIPLKVQEAWDLADVVEIARNHLKRFDEKFDALVKRYGEPQKDDPNKYQVPLKKIPAFESEAKELGEVEVAIKFPSFGIQIFNGSEISAHDIRGMRDLGILTKTKDNGTEKNSK